ncbi:hypothetical protein ACFL2H_13485 [Planctomycetota bacterium]
MTRSKTNRRIGNFENLEARKMMTADVGLDMADSMEPTVQVGRAFIADSFAFGVEREMKESGEKGGTTDMNIGVGELQEGAADRPIRSWSTSGDADDRPTEEVAFYYNRL